MSVVTLDGEIIHYEVLGRGRPLFFLHGWVGSWRYWVPTMQSVSIQYRAYALDFWGFGDTAKINDHYSIESQRELIDNFMDYMGIGKIAIVGHGLGAVVGLAFSMRFPQFVDRLLLTGLPIGQYSVNPRMSSSSIPELVEWLLKDIPGTEAAQSEAPRADQKAIAKSLENLQSINLQEMIKNLAVPCLLVHGKNDPAVQSPNHDFNDELPDSTHVVFFEQSGHFPMLEEQNKFNRLLGEFLSLTPGESLQHLQLKDEWRRRIR